MTEGRGLGGLPDIAVLEPGNTGASFWMPGIGVVLACFVWVVQAVGKSIGP